MSIQISMFQSANQERLDLAQTNTVDTIVSSLETYIIQAVEAGSDLIMFPELFISGYPHTQNKTTPALPSPLVEQHLKALAKNHNIAIFCGYETTDDTKLFNTFGFFTQDGTLAYSQNKRILFGDEPMRFDRAETDFANTYKPFVWQVQGQNITVGMCNCFEIEFPEVSRHLAQAGATLIICGAAIDEYANEVPSILVPARAIENQVFVAFNNYGITQGADHYFGGSCIVSPTGQKIAHTDAKSNIMITAVIDMNDIARSRKQFSYLDKKTNTQS